MISDEGIKAEAKLIGEYEIIFPEQQVLESGIFLGVHVVLNDVVAVDLSHEVMRIFKLRHLLKGLLVIFLNDGRFTKVDALGRETEYRLSSTAFRL